jgi:hypothetical protein
LYRFVCLLIVIIEVLYYFPFTSSLRYTTARREWLRYYTPFVESYMKQTNYFCSITSREIYSLDVITLISNENTYFSTGSNLVRFHLLFLFNKDIYLTTKNSKIRDIQYMQSLVWIYLIYYKLL